MSLLAAESFPHVALDPVFMELVSNGDILARKLCVVAPFRAQRRCPTKMKARKRRISIYGRPLQRVGFYRVTLDIFYPLGLHWSFMTI